MTKPYAADKQMAVDSGSPCLHSYINLQPNTSALKACSGVFEKQSLIGRWKQGVSTESTLNQGPAYVRFNHGHEDELLKQKGFLEEEREKVKCRDIYSVTHLVNWPRDYNHGHAERWHVRVPSRHRTDIWADFHLYLLQLGGQCRSQHQHILDMVHVHLVLLLLRHLPYTGTGVHQCQWKAAHLLGWFHYSFCHVGYSDGRWHSDTVIEPYCDASKSSPVLFYKAYILKIVVLSLIPLFFPTFLSVAVSICHLPLFLRLLKVWPTDCRLCIFLSGLPPVCHWGRTDSR